MGHHGEVRRGAGEGVGRNIEPDVLPCRGLENPEIPCSVPGTRKSSRVIPLTMSRRATS